MSENIKSKIINFDTFAFNMQDARQKQLRIVQCHGVFDLLHIGHIKHFQQAKRYGDILVVTITPDRYTNKGPHRPVFNQTLRAEAVASLACVDFAIINTKATAVNAIKIIQPSFYAKGIEYQQAEKDITGKIQEEVEAVQQCGGEVIYTNDVTFSSSALLNQFFPQHPEDVQSYLNMFKKKYSAELILDYFEKVRKSKILVVGEAIIDIYHFTEVIGKAGKEPILAALHRSQEIYAGGILALANHLSDFCEDITCLTYLGENGEYEEKIRSSLKSNITFIPIYKKDSPTIVKRRYLDEYLKQKLFEVYEINDGFFSEKQQCDFLSLLKQLLIKADMAIVADYGHGLLNEISIDVLTENAKFLAFNTQSNAKNHGFNCLSKYKKAHYVSIASRELQLNYRQKHLSITDQLRRLVQEFDYKQALVTQGLHGSQACRPHEPVTSSPAFTSSVVDRVGAGDAVLAITSLLAYLNAPSELIAFVGNVVGAEAVGTMGNKESISKIGLMKHIVSLLK